jgi:glycosyltransferase involved in cell wall biosynthesis
MSRAVDISVVVLSYDRVHLLERTLRACLRPDVHGDVAYEVIVVDNHPDQRARDLVEGLAAEGAPMRYLADPRRNISIVRNLGIAAAAGRYVAFVDDDEAPDAGWLLEFFGCLERTGADAAFGPKLPVFAEGHPPAWDPQGWCFTLDFQLPRDAEVQVFGRLRRKGKGLGSGNACFRKATPTARTRTCCSA